MREQPNNKKNNLVTAFNFLSFRSLDAPLSWMPGAVAAFVPLCTPLGPLTNTQKKREN